MGLLDSSASSAASGATAGTAIAPGIGTAIGAGLGLVSGLVGGIQSANANKRMQQYLTNEQDQNKAWYENNANGDYMQRGDTQALMGQLRNTLKNQNQQAENTAAVTGATPEQQAATKEASNQAIADTTSKIGALGQQWKDNVTDKYLQTKQNLDNQQDQLYGNQSQSGSNMLSNGIGAISNAAKGYASYLSIPKASTTPTSKSTTGTSSNPIDTMADE